MYILFALLTVFAVGQEQDPQARRLIVKLSKNLTRVEQEQPLQHVIADPKIARQLSQKGFKSHLWKVRRSSSAAGEVLLRITLEAEARPEEAAAILACHKHVVWAEPDYLVRLSSTPAKAPDNAIWGFDFLGVEDAWRLVEVPTEDVPVIAIIDTGVDLNHPDLASRIWEGAPGEFGFDWITGENIAPENDVLGHGTHCAAIAAGAEPEETEGLVRGTVGVCYSCEIMPLKVFDDNGLAHVSDIADAVDYARTHGAKIISMSFELSEHSQRLYEALLLARDSAFLVAAAGNSGLSREENPAYPAAYPFVLGVEAIDCDGNLAAFSNYGYDTQMPGYNILSASPDNESMVLPREWYNYRSGTSMAAPFATGLAGLIFASESDISPGTVFAKLSQYGHNAVAAIQDELDQKPLVYMFHEIISTGSKQARKADDPLNISMSFWNNGATRNGLNGKLSLDDGTVVSQTTFNAPAGDIAKPQFSVGGLSSAQLLQLKVEIWDGDVSASEGGLTTIQVHPRKNHSGILAQGESETWEKGPIHVVENGYQVDGTLTIEAGASLVIADGSWQVNGKAGDE